MKRSRAVPLVLMGSVAACDGQDAAQREAPPAPVFPTEQACLDTGVFDTRACEGLVREPGEAAPPAEARDYASLEDCQADDYFQDSYCVAKYEEAVALHQDYGPSYENVAACEADYGQAGCGRQTATAGGGSFWSPFLTGYLVSSAINSFSRPQPYYRDPYGGYRTMGGYEFNRDGRRGRYVPATAYRSTDAAARGTTNAAKARSGQLAKKPVRAQSQRTTVARRGGFGGRSGGRGG